MSIISMATPLEFLWLPLTSGNIGGGVYYVSFHSFIKCVHYCLVHVFVMDRLFTDFGPSCGRYMHTSRAYF